MYRHDRLQRLELTDPCPNAQLLLIELTHGLAGNGATDPIVFSFLLERLVQLGDVCVVPHLFPALKTAVGEQRPLVTSSIARLVPRTSSALVRFDKLLRATSRRYPPAWWPRGAPYRSAELTAEQVAALPTNESGSAELFGSLSCVRDGYTRHAALQSLARSESGAEIPFLLLRSNDCVPEVARLARKLLAGRLVPKRSAEFVRWLPLALRATRGPRGDTSLLRRLRTLLLESSEGSAAIEAALAPGSDAAIRQSAFELLQDGVPHRLVPALRQLVGSGSAGTAKAAAALLVSVRSNERGHDTLNILLHHRCPSLRVLALRAAEAHGSQVFARVAETLLCDAASSVRKTARAALPDWSRERFVEHYRHCLAEQSSAPAGAVWGLAEVGDLRHAAVVQALVNSEHTVLSQAAVSALRSMDARAMKPRPIRRRLVSQRHKGEP